MTLGYWMHETSGVLKPAVEAYLKGGQLSAPHVAAMRAYLRQWIMSPVWDQNPYGTVSLAGLRDLVDSLHSRAQIDTWIRKAVDLGIDPL